MNALIFRKAPILPALGLATVLAGTLVVIPPAQAVMYLRGGSDQPTEGDPLDANDFSTGGDGLIDDIIQDSFAAPVTGGDDLVIAVPVRDAVVYLLVDFQDGIPVLRFVKVPGASSLVEASDAR